MAEPYPGYYAADFLGLPGLSAELYGILGSDTRFYYNPVDQAQVDASSGGLLPGFLPGADALPGS